MTKMKKFRYLSEAFLLGALMLIFKIMPIDWASAIGGFFGWLIGPRLAASRKARRNLDNALPNLTEREKSKVIRRMWTNLGRVMAEYPHLAVIGHDRVKIKNAEIMQHLIDTKEPCMTIAAHMANWELAPAVMESQFGASMDITYRAPNNPWVDKLLQRMRNVSDDVQAYPKSRAGGQQLVKAMRDGRYIGMLIDQKYNEGVAVPFFGMPAMTNHAFVQLCQKFDYKIVPVRFERTKGAHFVYTIYAPLQTKDDKGQDLPVENVIEQAHMLLEDWIRKKPSQWLWLHRRWDSEKLKDTENKATEKQEES